MSTTIPDRALPLTDRAHTMVAVKLFSEYLWRKANAVAGKEPGLRDPELFSLEQERTAAARICRACIKFGVSIPASIEKLVQ